MRKLTFLLLAILVSGGLYAQLPSFGIKVGATAATLSTSEIAANYDSENLLGYQVGAFMRLKSGKLYLQPEVLYNNRKSNFFDDLNAENRFETGTIDIPILVGFKLLDAKVFNLRAFVGPEASLQISDNTDPETSKKYEISKTNWYMQAGVGVDLLFLTFDIRYEKGLNDFITEAQADNNFKNNVWVFSLGLKFM